MKRVLFTVLLLLGACSCGSQGDNDASTGIVANVLDGDSVLVRIDGREVEVRLFGIDAPEHGQPYSDQARAGLEQLIEKRPAQLHVIEKDRYGRSVAELIRESDQLNVNTEMIRLGHAWVYRQYNDDKEWIAIETGARDAGRGLWALPDPVPPWEWRRDNPREKRDRR